MFIKCNSHRARDRVRDQLSNTKCYYSFERSSTGGYFQVTEAELASIKERKVKGVTVLRAPYDDVRECF
jgi:hypothetical protein